MSDNVLLNWALNYARQGLSVFPVNAKIPLIKWKEYQERCASEQEIKEWWAMWPDADIGLVTGKITKRLVLDIDGPEGRDSISGKFIPACPSVRTRRGIQYHFRLPDNLPKTTLAGILPGVDVRGDGGYVKVPPSKCSDGTRYGFMVGRSLQELPLPDAPQWLIDLLSKKKNLEGYEKVGPTIKEKWLAEIIDGVPVGQQHHALVKLAGWYFGRMPADIAETLIRQWNERNTPPMEIADFEFQLRDLKRRYSKDFDKFKEPVTLEQPEKMASMDLTEFLTSGAAHIDWLVPGLIPKKSATILGGIQGLGKSWMTLDLALEMVRGGGTWLNHFPVEGGSVLYIDEESAEQLLRFRIKKLVSGKKGVQFRFPLKLSVGTGLNLSDARSVENLKQLMEEVKPKLVVIDSLIRSHTADENSASDMKRVFRVVKSLMEEFDCSFLFIDHERKPSQFDTSSSQRLRGSSEKAAFIDTLISLRRKDGGLIVKHSKSRYAKPLPTFGLVIEDMDNATFVAHAGAVEEVQ